jgi:hypothetical protein
LARKVIAAAVRCYFCSAKASSASGGGIMRNTLSVIEIIT